MKRKDFPPAFVARRALLGVAALLLTTGAQAATYTKLVPAQSRLQFTIKQMNVPVEGSFTRFEAQLQFDPAKPQAAKAEMRVAIASIEAGGAEANGEAQGKDWFNTKVFPEAVFRAESFRLLEKGRYEVRGQLSIKGVAKSLTLPLRFREEKGMGFFEGEFSLAREDFHIGAGAWADPSIVSPTAQVRFTLAISP